MVEKWRTAQTLESAVLEASSEIQARILKELANKQVTLNLGRPLVPIGDNPDSRYYIYWNPRDTARVPEYTPEQQAELQHCLDTLDDAVDADVYLEELRLKAESLRSRGL